MSFLTLEEAKDYLEVSGSDMDAQIQLWLDAVSESIIAYCENDFETHVITNELHDGRKADILLPKMSPVASIQAIYFGVKADGSSGSLLDSNSYVLRDDEIALVFSHTQRGRGIIRLDYTAGYATVPSRVILATQLGLQGYYNLTDKATIGIRTKAKEGESISYQGGWNKQFGLPEESISLLAEFRDYGWPETTVMATRNI